jgi:hypothetical protein
MAIRESQFFALPAGLRNINLKKQENESCFKDISQKARVLTFVLPNLTHERKKD